MKIKKTITSLLVTTLLLTPMVSFAQANNQQEIIKLQLIRTITAMIEELQEKLAIAIEKENALALAYNKQEEREEVEERRKQKKIDKLEKRKVELRLQHQSDIAALDEKYEKLYKDLADGDFEAEWSSVYVVINGETMRSVDAKNYLINERGREKNDLIRDNNAAVKELNDQLDRLKFPELF